MRKIFICAILLFASFGVAQQSKPQQKPDTPVPGLGIEVQDQRNTGSKPAKPQGPETAPAPLNPQAEHKITPAEAEQLFRSLDEIAKFDSKVTGLQQKQPIKRELASRDRVQHFIETRMKDDEDAKRLERSEVVLKKLGLFPRDFDLRSYLVQLLKEQVAGYYDAKMKTVYLLDWLDPDAQKPVMAHELTHALQDQNFDLEKFAKTSRNKNDMLQDERLAARQAVMEGQAMISLINWMLAPFDQSVEKSPQAVDFMVNAMASNPGSAKLESAPQYLRDVLIFPYTYGLNFVRTVLTKQGKDRAFAGLFKSPPRDTRDIMHPELYLSGNTLPPLSTPDFDKLLGPQFKRFDLSYIGQFDVFEIVKQFASEQDAKTLSPEYRGAYTYVASRGEQAPKSPSDVVIVFVSHWSNMDAAQQFADVWRTTVAKRYRSANKADRADRWTTADGPVTIEQNENTVIAIEGLDETTAGKVRAALADRTSRAAAQ